MYSEHVSFLAHLLDKCSSNIADCEATLSALEDQKGYLETAIQALEVYAHIHSQAISTASAMTASAATATELTEGE